MEADEDIFTFRFRDKFSYISILDLTNLRVWVDDAKYVQLEFGFKVLKHCEVILCQKRSNFDIELF